MAKFLFLTPRSYRKSRLKQSKNSKGTAVFVSSLKNFFFNRYFPANIPLDEDVLKTSWRYLDQGEYVRLSLTSSRCLQDVLVKINIFVLAIRLQDVFKTSSIRLAKMLWRRFQDVLQKRLQDIFKTSSRRFEGVFKTSSRHLQDVFKTSSKRLEKRLQGIIKTSSRRFENVFKASCKDIFKTFSRRIIKLNCSC